MGMLCQGTQLYKSQCTGHVGVSGRQRSLREFCFHQLGVRAPLQPPQCQPLLESLFASIWARFNPKVCFPNKVAVHAHVDNIPKPHNELCLMRSSPVLQDKLAEIWAQEVEPHGLKPRRPEKNSTFLHKHKTLAVKNGLSRAWGIRQHLSWCL